MVLDIVLAPMALTPKTFNVGETIRVTVSFKYAVGVNTTVRLLADCVRPQPTVVMVDRGFGERYNLYQPI